MVAECQGGDFLIKLFGKTIPVPEPESGDAKDLEQSSSSTEQDQDAHAQGLDKAHAHPDSPSDPSPPQPEIVDADEPKSPPETHRQKPSDGDAAGQRERLRKPDKVLPCPRCNSRDTKFCYFNNYNVNQPRHFCKRCQRYWTAGGAMRNVPVGAGCRKTKSAAAASHFLHRVRAALPPACGGGGDTLETTNGGTVLSFGRNDGARPGSGLACLDLGLAAQLGHLAPVRNAGAPGPCSEGSIDRSSVVDESAANGDGAVQQHPASVNTGWPPYSGCSAPPLAAYFSSGIAIPIYSAAPGYWGCMVPGAWSLPWPVQPQPLSSRSQGISSSSSSPTTTAAPSVSSSSGAADSHALGLGLGLGKHPRDRDGGDGRNGSAHGSGSAKVWAPKTIRIDDVDEVARSSIWSLIGIRGDKEQQDTGGTVFEPRRDATKKAMVTSSPFVHANPVALTRSVAFQEGS